MTLRHYAFSRQHRTQFSEDVYAFVLWRKELFVPGIVVSTIKRKWRCDTKGWNGKLGRTQSKNGIFN